MFYFQEEEENNEELNLVINFNNINMDVITKNDSFKILNTSLKYSDNIFIMLRTSIKIVVISGQTSISKSGSLFFSKHPSSNACFHP